MAQRVTLALPNPAFPGQDVNVGSVSAGGQVVGFPTTDAPSSSGAVTNVNDTATSTTLIAANASRRGLVITNTSSAILYVRLASGTASATMFTYRLPQNATQEIMYPYTGIVTGVWATDPNDGVAVITELT